MTNDSEQLSPVELLAEEFLERRQRGERPTIAEYCRRHPDLEDEIRDVFEALAMVEELKPASSDASGTCGAGVQPANESLQRVGDYRIFREVGRGGMGVVYEAEQESLGRRVALKVLPRSAAGDKKALLRFQREARAAARMHHTNIVPVFEVGDNEDVVFYAMQLIQGQGLDLVIDELRDLKSERAQTSRKKAESKKGPSSSRPAPSIALSLVSGKFDRQNLVDEMSKPTDPKGSESSDPSNPAFAATETIDAARSVTSSAALPGQADISSAENNRSAYFLSVAEIGRQTASALSYAHSRGIIHRDIKPSNLILDTTGVVWVTDFGLAKTGDSAMTHTGDILGTLRYMSPERFRGHCDVRADIYSLGLTLYEMLVLKPAFDSPDRVNLIDRIAKSEVPTPRSIDPRIPRDLETIVLKACDKDPRHRYQSADDMSDDLQRFIHDEPIHARRISTVERFARWSRRNKTLATSIITVAVLLVVIAVGASAMAKINANLAANKAALAEEKTAQAEEMSNLAAEMETRARRSKQLALAAQADAIRENLPQRALLLASKSWQMATEAGDPPPRLALEAIHATLAQCGGRTVMKLPRQDFLIDGPVGIRPDDEMYEGSFGNNFKRFDMKSQEQQLTIPLASPHSWARPIASTHQWLAEGTPDGDIYIYNMGSSSPEDPVKKWRAHDSTVRYVDIDERQSRLVTLAKGECKIWNLDRLPHLDADAADAVIELPFDRPEFTIDSAGTRLAFSQEDDIQVLIYHVDMGQRPVQELALTIPKRSRRGQPVFSPDGRYLSVGAYRDTFTDILRFDLQDERVQDSKEVLGSHISTVFGMFYTMDGKLITYGDDYTAQVFDDSRPHGVVLRGHMDAIWIAAASSSGRYLATGSGDHTIRLWDLNEVDPNWTVQVLRGHEDSVRKLVFTGDEQVLYSRSDDDTVRSWEIGSSNPLETWRKLKGSFNASYFCTEQFQASPQVCANGRLFVSTRDGVSTFDGRPRIWNVDENDFHGKELDLPKAATFGPTIICNNGRWVFQQRGKRLISVDGDEPKIHVLPSISDAELLKAWFDPRSRYLLTFHLDGQIYRWDLTVDDPTSDPKLIFVLATKLEYAAREENVADDAALSPDGRWMFAADGKGRVFRWDLRISDPSTSRQTFRIAKPGALQLRVSPNGSLLVAYSKGADGNEPPSLTFWTLKDGVPGGEPVRRLVLPWPMFTGFQFDPNSRYLAVSLGSEVWVWDIASVTKGPYKLTEHSSVVHSFAFSSRGTLLATSEQTGDILVWDLEGDDPEQAIERLAAHKTPCPGLRFYDHDTRLLSVGYDVTLRSWDLDRKRVVVLAHEIAGRDLTDEELKQFDLESSGNDTR